MDLGIRGRLLIRLRRAYMGSTPQSKQNGEQRQDGKITVSLSWRPRSAIRPFRFYHGGFVVDLSVMEQQGAILIHH